jgi:hypothetical protein
MPTRPKSRHRDLCGAEKAPCDRAANHRVVMFDLFTFEMTYTGLVDGAPFGAAAGDRGTAHPTRFAAGASVSAISLRRNCYR